MGKFTEKIDKTWSKDSIRLILDTPSEIKNVLFYIQELGCFSTTHPYYTERDGLNSFLIIFTLHGTGMLEINNSTHELRQNSIAFIDCSSLHKYYTTKTETWDFYWVHFYGNSIKGIHNYFISQSNSNIVTTRNPALIEGYFNKLLEINTHPADANPFLNFQNLSLLLSDILMITTPIKFSKNKISELFINIISHIDTNFLDEDICLESVGKLFIISPFILSREFKRYFGIGFKEYIIKKRIAYSKELLLYSHFNIDEICLKIGLKTSSYFIHLFKIIEGMTPLKYRQLWKNST